MGGVLMSTRVHVDRWAYDRDNAIVQYDGKLLIVRFDKVLGFSDNLNTFYVLKDIYVKKLDLICQYINYFIEYYDNDNELIMAYAKLKFLIDNKEKVKKIKEKGFIKAIYDILFTKTMIEKIKLMVEENYDCDLITDSTKKYNKSLEFNNEHAKILQMISLSIKMLIPIITHFSNSRKIKKPNYFRYFERLFTLFDDEIKIYTKLYVMVRKKVMDSYKAHALTWQQKEILYGSDPTEFIDTILIDRIIVDAMFKYTLDKSVHSWNTAVINNQLNFFLMDKYDYAPKQIDFTKDAEGLSSVDKMAMNMSKLDESLITLSEMNIKHTIKKIKKKYNIIVMEDEIEYYMQYHKIDKFIIQFVHAFYAKYFCGYNDLMMLTKRQYIEIMIILKKKLIYDGYVFLPQIISGNVFNKVNSRVIQNNKFLLKISESDLYHELKTEKYAYVNELKDDGQDIIIKLLSNLINTKFLFVDFDMQDKLGEIIDIDNNTLSEEFLKFLSEV